MTLVLKENGRHRADCDGPECAATVDTNMSPRVTDAERVIRNFFGWSVTGGKHLCPACQPREPARRRRGPRLRKNRYVQPVSALGDKE